MSTIYVEKCGGILASRFIFTSIQSERWVVRLMECELIVMGMYVMG